METTQTINKDIINIDSLIEYLKENIELIIENKISNIVDDNIAEYFKTKAVKNKIKDYLEKNLDITTEKEILTAIKKCLTNEKLDEKLNDKIEEKITKIISKCLGKVEIPKNNYIILNHEFLGPPTTGYFHEKFEQILEQVQLNEPIMLIGPAGSGKNHAIKQVADALGKHMYYTNNASNEFKLTGFIDAGGVYRETEFYKAFKNGGVFFLDEIDNSDPSALIVINSALSNGYMAFPNETIDRHKDFRMVSAANTWGKGADLQYVGRNPLDATTLDRFDNIFFDYDRKLEESLYPNKEVLEFMWAFRDAVEKSKVLHVVSTRGIGKVYKKEMNGIPTENILTSNVIKNLSQDDLNIILGNMKGIDKNNKFYSKVKKIRLR